MSGRAEPVSSGVLPLLPCLLLGSMALCLSAVCLSALCSNVFSVCDFAGIYLYREDRWLLLVQASILLVASLRLGVWKRRLDLPNYAVPLIAIGLCIFCYAGAKWLLFDYAFSRDEQMAIFDSQVFRAGHVVQPLSRFWQIHAGALNTTFMWPEQHPAAWISSYLPMNAALRALAGFLGDAALTGPMMVGLGLVSLWNCARLLWPEDREAAVVAVLLYVGSGQVLFAGMTAYAMPAHLAFNLLWLWCFLLDRRAADFAALLVAFVATGLHQPLFHPLFAAPILLTLVPQRNWMRLAIYAIGYAAICAFWFSWPMYVHPLVTGPGSIPAPAGVDYLSRLLETLSQPQPMRLGQLGTNLLRFFAWQHLLLLPLMVCGFVAARRENLAVSFAAAVILPVIVMMLIMPSQGNGFGYRYLHGVIGAAILLAVYGWRQVADSEASVRPLFLSATAAAVILLLPLQAWLGHNLYARFARIDRQISGSGDDYFVTFFPDGLVINRPDLSNRPIRLLGKDVSDDLIRSICAPGVRVAVPTSALLHPIETYFMLPHSTTADARIAALSARLQAAGCTVDPLDAE